MRQLTIVYKIPDDFDVAALYNHPHASAFAWSHKIDECRKLMAENKQLRAERNRSGVELRNAVSKSVREEREACARLCDGRFGFAGEVFAEYIRARSDK